jgi:hypothetical protein
VNDERLVCEGDDIVSMETNVRPIVASISELASDPDCDEQRLNGIVETLKLHLEPLGASDLLGASANEDQSCSGPLAADGSPVSCGGRASLLAPPSRRHTKHPDFRSASDRAGTPENRKPLDRKPNVKTR